MNGQKEFGETRKMFTKFAGNLGFMRQQSLDVNSALQKGKKLKKQRLSINFNPPENPKDNVSARFTFMGKDHDFWMSEATKFWDQHFKGKQRVGPTSYARLAIPI